MPVSLVFLSLAPPMLMATNPCSARSSPRLASTKPRLLPVVFPRTSELQPWTRAWRTLTSQKTACSCSLSFLPWDRRTPVAKRSAKKKKKRLVVGRHCQNSVTDAITSLHRLLRGQLARAVPTKGSAVDTKKQSPWLLVVMESDEIPEQLVHPDIPPGMHKLRHNTRSEGSYG